MTKASSERSAIRVRQTGRCCEHPFPRVQARRPGRGCGQAPRLPHLAGGRADPPLSLLPPGWGGGTGREPGHPATAPRTAGPHAQCQRFPDHLQPHPRVLQHRPPEGAVERCTVVSLLALVRKKYLQLFVTVCEEVTAAAVIAHSDLDFYNYPLNISSITRNTLLWSLGDIGKGH